MKWLPWARDTIALRFALTVTLAVVVTAVLVALLSVVGVDRPEIERSGLPGQIVAIVRIIENTPPTRRSGIAVAAATEVYRVEWYGAGSPVGEALRAAATKTDKKTLVAEFLGEDYQAVIFNPDIPVASIPVLRGDRENYPDSYFLGVKLFDDSWIVFTAFSRTWGLDREKRRTIWVLLCVVSILLVSWLAARRLSRPIKSLAEAVRAFGSNPTALPLPETGPRELKQVVRMFNAMQAQIQKFLVHRTTMLAAISHDLRTPLTRIRLRGEFIEDEVQRARLFRDVDEMQAMVDGALAFFRDDAADEAVTDIDLPGLFRTIVNDYGDQGIHVEYLGPARATYRGRPFALKRAFTNLIQNAIKYATPPAIELVCGKDAVVVLIRDRGPGIPPRALDWVFDPYFRLDDSRNRTTGGVGLGLTAARAIICAHGGTIELANRREGGLEARITFPCADPPPRGRRRV